MFPKCKVAHLNNRAKSDWVNKISSFEYVDDCFLREIVKYVCPFKVMHHAAGQIFFFSIFRKKVPDIGIGQIYFVN